MNRRQKKKYIKREVPCCHYHFFIGYGGAEHELCKKFRRDCWSFDCKCYHPKYPIKYVE